MDGVIGSSNRMMVVRAVFFGLILGILARAWMRWIATEPKFSWTGSIFIVSAFTLFVTTQSVVSLLRKKELNRISSSLVRLGGVVFSLPLFTAAGTSMLPTVTLASVALWRNQLKKSVRVIFLALSLVIPILLSMDIINDFGWSMPTIGRIAAFALIYLVIIYLLEPTLSGRSNYRSS